jgi:hypothetical protein
MNQNILYDIYEPKKPNDLGLFKIWSEELVKRGVDIYLNSEVTHVEPNHRSYIIGNDHSNQTIEYLATKEYRFYGTHFIFAMPPLQIHKIFSQTHLNTGFRNNFEEWSQQTNYITYIPVVFHWKKNIDIRRVWGYPQTSWGVGFIVMSDYMDFEDPRSVTVISAAITVLNKSEYLNKTPNEVDNSSELIKEVYRQLKTVLPNIPEYDQAVMSQNRYDGEKWVPLHTAFMTTKHGYIGFRSDLYRNLYNCGVQNGKSTYSFTSLESSVINAIELLYEFVPESKKDIRIREATTFRFVWFVMIILISTLLCALFLVRYRRYLRWR